MTPAKRYIGDGVYVEFDGFSIVVTTENGIKVTNRIVLELEVYTSLVDYVNELITALKARKLQVGG